MKRSYGIIAGVGIVGACIVYVFLSSASGGGIVRQLGSVVGMYASIEPNEYNILAQQLDSRQKELDQKEQELQQERLVVEQISQQSNKTTMIYITAIGSLLLVLVLLNYYFDWRRRK